MNEIQLVPTIRSKMLLEELKTDGHKPMKFLCDNGSIYFCKNRISVNKAEMDFLAYEVVCHFLLKTLQIPTPEIAFVEIQEGSFDKNKMPANRKRTTSGSICFGSKAVEPNTIISGIQNLATKRDFGRLLNPGDIIRIGLFDLWVKNTDRAKGDNYNLLLQGRGQKSQIVAIDHAFAFGGLDGLRFFKLNDTDFFDSGRLLRSAYFKEVVKYFSRQERRDISDSFISLLQQDTIQYVISQSFKQIPSSWQIWPDLQNRVADFLLSHSRMAGIQTEAHTLILTK